MYQWGAAIPESAHYNIKARRLKMKHITLFLFFSALTCSTLFANDSIKLAIGDWAPYTSSTDQTKKLLEKVVTEAFKLEGITVHYDIFHGREAMNTPDTGNLPAPFHGQERKPMKEIFICTTFR